MLYLVRGDTIVGGVALEDEVRPEARHAVAELQAMGRRVVMITGDARQVAEAVGADLGVDEVLAEVLPEDKDAKVAELQARGLKVAMVGDGVNDAPALARADVGIAIGAGTDVAIESAGLILASSDPRAVVGIIRLSKAAYRKSLQNLWWAAGYNIVAIPLAAGALAWAGITMPPAARRRPDERLHHRRGPQRPAPAPRRPPPPGPRRTGSPIRHRGGVVLIRPPRRRDPAGHGGDGGGGGPARADGRAPARPRGRGGGGPGPEGRAVSPRARRRHGGCRAPRPCGPRPSPSPLA